MGGILQSSSEPEVTLFIPTWNAGVEFRENYRLMSLQELDRSFEILIIDSGSTDGTIEFLKSQEARLIQIPSSEFNHGFTRNRAIQEAKGEIVIMTVQDARPYDRYWMQKLVDGLTDPRVAGAYSRQLPRSDANPLIKERLKAWSATSERRKVQFIEDRAEFEALQPLEKMSRVIFDNVSSCVRRSVALEIPFRRRQFGEDIDWGYRAILGGYRIVFEPQSKVIHSHNRSSWYEFKRIYLDHQNLHGLFGVHTVPSLQHLLASMRYGIAENFKLIRNAELLGFIQRLEWWIRGIPHAIASSLGQFLGARSARWLEEEGKTAVVLDRFLRRGV